MTSKSIRLSIIFPDYQFPTENHDFTSPMNNRYILIFLVRYDLKIDIPFGVELLARPTKSTLSSSPIVLVVRKVLACCKVDVWLRSNVMKIGTLGVGFKDSIRYIAFRVGSPTFFIPNLKGNSVIEWRATDSRTKLKYISGVAPRYSYLKISLIW